MAPVVHGLESDYAGRIKFVFLDIDDPGNEPFKRQLGYRVQPHMFLLDGEGTVIASWLGKTDADEIATAFDELLAQEGG
jgi:hypothetical protein